MFKLLCYLLLLIKILHIYSQTCQFVSDLKVSYDENWEVDNENHSSQITGCMTNASFKIEKVAVIAIYCNSKYLPVAETNLITDMEYLKYIYIGTCFLQSIEPGAFSNLPQLIKININNNPFKKISAGIFNVLPSLEILELFKNQVTEFEDYAFANLPNLREFSISQNKLTHLKKNWFENSTNIVEIKFFLNSIREVPSGMFHGWRKLKHLDLSANYISKLDGPLLKDNSPYMNIVGLHRNLLTTVSLEMFSDSIFIGYLLISGNRLNYIPDDLLNKLQLSEVSIFANPFTCPCYNRIYQTLYKRGITVNKASRLTNEVCVNNDVPVCGNPSNHTNTCVEAVDQELTARIMNHMKEVRYDTVVDYLGQQCFTFDSYDK